MFVTSSLSGDLIGLFVAFSVLLITYWKWAYQYWHRQNLPYLKPEIPFGNFSNALRGKEHFGVNLANIYKEMKSRKWKHGGAYLFTKPHYIPIDLDFVRNVMTKDFQNFADRDFYVNEKEPLQAHLLSLRGQRWRNMRSKLSPTFTSGKMKMMFQVMADCEGVLHQRMDEECARKDPINIKEILACFTTNIIGTCAFGLDFNALEDENSAFRAIGRKMFAFSRWKSFKRLFATTFPSLFKTLRIPTSDRDLAKFIIDMVQDTIDYREKNNFTRNDFMQMMINLKNKPETGDHDGKPLTMDEVASQCLVFFAAGFETSSTLMTFTLYELAMNQDVQDKLRTDIRRVLASHDNKITYESIQDNKYLGQVMDEALRKHPPAAQTNRQCIKDYRVPGEDVVIKKGTTVTISILGIHRDPEIYPEPEKFDPERFSDENKAKRHNYAHIPFGEGPRNCIGMRFGLLQAKVGLVALLKNYKFTINRKTQLPMTYTPSGAVLAIQGELWLDAQKI